MAVMDFLAILSSKYDYVKVQILPNPEISYFQDTFNMILRLISLLI